MKKTSLIFSLLSISLLSTACSNKKCVSKDAHSGLYNALTCNYEENIQLLKLSLNTKTMERNRLFHNYQRLIAQVSNKEEKITLLEEEIKNIDKNIQSIQTLFTDVQKSTPKALTVLKLKSRLKTLNMNILNKSTIFDVEDAIFTNQKLLTSTDKQLYAEAYDKNLLKDEKYAMAYHKNLLENKKYAQAYNKNLLKDKKYAQAYDKLPSETFAKAYQADIDTDKQLRLSISSQIQDIQNSLTSNTFSSTEESVKNLIENVKKYNNSQKKS